MFCLQCGHKIPVGSEVCLKCGAISTKTQPAGPAIRAETKALASSDRDSPKAKFKDCPNCGLVNPSAAERCDCGYDFARWGRDGEVPLPGYRWGNFLGIGAFLAAIFYLWTAIDTNGLPAGSGSPWLLRLVAILFAVMWAVAAVGILRRRRFGVVVYAAMALIAVMVNLIEATDSGSPASPKGEFGTGRPLLLPWAMMNLVYLGKRWRLMDGTWHSRSIRARMNYKR